jgi:diphthamide biosynthesis protein 3
MASLPYEEIALEDMEFSEALDAFTYTCPCGDLFQISGDELAAGEDIAHCPSCSLVIRVLLDTDAFAKMWTRRDVAEERAPS